MTHRTLPLAAMRRLREIVPVSMSAAQVATIADWAAGLVDAARNPAIDAWRAVPQVSSLALMEMTAVLTLTPRPAAPSSATSALDPTPAQPSARPVPGRPDAWTADEDAALREMVAEHLSQVEMATRLKRSRKGVANRMLRLGLTGQGPSWRGWTEACDARLRQLAAEGSPASSIAAGMGRPDVSVRQRAMKLGITLQPATGPRWSRDDKAELKRLVNSGMRRDEIAAVMGRSLNSIHGELHRLRRSGGRADEPAASDKVAEPAPTAPPAARGGVTAAARADHANGKAQRATGRPTASAAKPLTDSAVAVVPSSATVQASEDEAEDPVIAALAGQIAIDISAPARPEVLKAMAHLDRLPFDLRFDAAADLKVLVELGQGRSSAAIAEDLDLEARDIGARFRVMVPPALQDRRTGALTLSGRAILLEAAKRNAVGG